MQMTLASIRRYPVKSMGGESLDEVAIDRRGLVGDRWYAVEDDEGRFASGKNTRRFRRRDAVFEYAARTEGDQVVVSGRGGTWTAGDPALDVELTRALAAHVAVLPEGSERHQDGGQVSLVSTATLDWCEQRWGIVADPRRLRVNLVIAADTPFIEEGWMDREVTIGDVRLRVVEQVARCRTVDIDQDGARAEGRWLKALTRERDMFAAVYADVVVPGTVHVGDRVG